MYENTQVIAVNSSLKFSQTKAFVNPSKQMRWHPLVIKWCLRQYNESHKSYNDMRKSKVPRLPNGKTLSDYKNFNHQETE